MHPDAPKLIWDAHDSAQTVDEFIDGRSFAEYTSNRMLHSAVERQLEIVGEALNQLRRIDPETAARIPDISGMIAFRNILVHAYSVIDDSEVWRVIQDDLPDLRKTLTALLGEIGPPR